MNATPIPEMPPYDRRMATEERRKYERRAGRPLTEEEAMGMIRSDRERDLRELEFDRRSGTDRRKKSGDSTEEQHGQQSTIV